MPSASRRPAHHDAQSQVLPSPSLRCGPASPLGTRGPIRAQVAAMVPAHLAHSCTQQPGAGGGAVRERTLSGPGPLPWQEGPGRKCAAGLASGLGPGRQEPCLLLPLCAQATELLRSQDVREAGGILMSFSEPPLVRFLEKTGSWGPGRKPPAPWEAACGGAAEGQGPASGRPLRPAGRSLPEALLPPGCPAPLGRPGGGLGPNKDEGRAAP